MTAPRTLPRIVFAGTADFAVPTLAALRAAGYPVCAVYTQPDRPAGRGRQMRASPVKEQAAGLPVRQPATLRDPGVQRELADGHPDLMVVAAYGLLLPAAVLAVPRWGCLNVHASLLPRWRGAAPVQRALLAGDTLTGISIMQMDVGLDTGPLLATAPCAIEPAMSAGELLARLADLGARTLLEILPDWVAGRLTPRPQDEALATYAPKLDKAEAELNWTQPAHLLERRVRAFNPWPVAHTRFEGQIVRVWRACVLAATADVPPGTVIGAGQMGIDVATGDGVLRITELQLAGKRVMSAADFSHARRVLGQRLGSA